MLYGFPACVWFLTISQNNLSETRYDHFTHQLKSLIMATFLSLKNPSMSLLDKVEGTECWNVLCDLAPNYFSSLISHLPNSYPQSPALSAHHVVSYLCTCCSLCLKQIFAATLTAIPWSAYLALNKALKWPKMFMTALCLVVKTWKQPKSSKYRNNLLN